MNADELKHLIEHLASDAEAIAVKFGKPELAARIEKLKTLAENPIVLQIAVQGINAAIERLEAAK